MKNTNPPSVDLSQWDVASDFSGDEVAALVRGEDPSEVGYVNSQKKPIYQKLEQSYNASRKWHLLADDEPFEWDENGITSKEKLLCSVGLTEALDNFDQDEAANFQVAEH